MPKILYSHWRKTLSRQGFVLHIGPAAFFISLAVSPSSAFRLGSASEVRPLRLDFRVSKAVNVSASPIRLVNPLLFFLLSSSSLHLTGAENTTLSITRRSNSVSNGLSLEATCYLSIGENRLLLAASPIYSIMAGLETSKEDLHLYPGTIIASLNLRDFALRSITTPPLSYIRHYMTRECMVNTHLKRLGSACSQYNHNLTCTRFNNRNYW